MFDVLFVKLNCFAHNGDMRLHLILFTRLITKQLVANSKLTT